MNYIFEKAYSELYISVDGYCIMPGLAERRLIV